MGLWVVWSGVVVDVVYIILLYRLLTASSMFLILMLALIGVFTLPMTILIVSSIHWNTLTTQYAL